MCANLSYPPMLAATANAAPVPVSRQDAFATTFADQQFGAIVCLRFLFHVGQPERLLAEWRRLLKPGGIVVFDTLRWTPRGLFPPLDRALGGGLYPYGEARLHDLATDAGFRVVATERALLLPSLAYHYLPAPLVGPVQRLEQHVPTVLFTKAFLHLQVR